MSKRKPLNKEQARERRDRLLDAAAAAELALAAGVREMRAIAGMTQEEFARHRGVSARVIKAIELDQGNPTVATMNRIGEFFGLEIGFVPIKRNEPDEDPQQPQAVSPDAERADLVVDAASVVKKLSQMVAEFEVHLRTLKQQQVPPRAKKGSGSP